MIILAWCDFKVYSNLLIRRYLEASAAFIIHMCPWESNSTHTEYSRFTIIKLDVRLYVNVLVQWGLFGDYIFLVFRSIMVILYCQQRLGEDTLSYICIKHALLEVSYHRVCWSMVAYTCVLSTYQFYVYIHTYSISSFYLWSSFFYANPVVL